MATTKSNATKLFDLGGDNSNVAMGLETINTAGGTATAAFDVIGPYAFAILRPLSEPAGPFAIGPLPAAAAPTTLNAATIADLNADIAQANLATSGSFVINLTANIAEAKATTAIALKSGVSLSLVGKGYTLDAGKLYRGLYVYSGNVTVRSLTIQNAAAIGSPGGPGRGSGGGGGGGAGLGGALFIGSLGHVTLSGVRFHDNTATGGAGGNGGLFGSMGGGGPGGGGVNGALGAGGAGATGVTAGQNGGFGGGGGGAGGGGTFGAGGFGAGNGNIGKDSGSGGSAGTGGAGGGGLGAGGDIFLQQGGALSITAAAITAGGVHSGIGGTAAGGAKAGSGKAFGGAIFLQGAQTLTLGTSQTAAMTTTIAGAIADQTGSGGKGAKAGLGSLVVTGLGKVVLGGADSFSGGVTLDSGALEFANAASGGKGAVTFAANANARLELGAGTAITQAIAGFAAGDSIDFLSLTYVTGDTATDTGGLVTIKTAGGTAVASFDVAGTYVSANFQPLADATGHLEIAYTPAAAIALLSPLATPLAATSTALIGAPSNAADLGRLASRD